MLATQGKLVQEQPPCVTCSGAQGGGGGAHDRRQTLNRDHIRPPRMHGQGTPHRVRTGISSSAIYFETRYISTSAHPSGEDPQHSLMLVFGGLLHSKHAEQDWARRDLATAVLHI